MKHKLLFFGGAGMLLSYIGMEIHKASHRYDTDQEHLESNHWIWQRVQKPQGIAQTKQLTHVFEVKKKDDPSCTVTATLLMGQEPTSYFHGHLHFDSHASLSSSLRKELYQTAISFMKQQLMHHLYFVCDGKDSDAIALYQGLGAVYTKDVLDPQATDTGKKKPLQQYRLLLVEEKEKKNA